MLLFGQLMFLWNEFAIFGRKQKRNSCIVYIGYRVGNVSSLATCFCKKSVHLELLCVSKKGMTVNYNNLNLYLILIQNYNILHIKYI